MRQLLVVSCLLLAASCRTTTDLPAALSQPVDSSLRQGATVARLLGNGRIKVKGPVTLQIGGTGNTASTTAAPKSKAPVAAGPAAVATDASKKVGTPWQVLAGGALVCLGLGAWLAWKLKTS